MSSCSFVQPQTVTAQERDLLDRAAFNLLLKQPEVKFTQKDVRDFSKTFSTARENACDTLIDNSQILKSVQEIERSLQSQLPDSNSLVLKNLCNLTHFCVEAKTESCSAALSSPYMQFPQAPQLPAQSDVVNHVKAIYRAARCLLIRQTCVHFTQKDIQDFAKTLPTADDPIREWENGQIILQKLMKTPITSDPRQNNENSLACFIACAAMEKAGLKG